MSSTSPISNEPAAPTLDLSTLVLPPSLFIEKAKNEFPENIRSQPDVKQYEQDKQVKPTLESVKRERDDVAILSESYEIMYGTWDLLQRNPECSNLYVQAPTPEFKKLVEDINMSAFMPSNNPHTSMHQVSMSMPNFPSSLLSEAVLSSSQQQQQGSLRPVVSLDDTNVRLSVTTMDNQHATTTTSIEIEKKSVPYRRDSVTSKTANRPSDAGVKDYKKVLVDQPRTSNSDRSSFSKTLGPSRPHRPSIFQLFQQSDALKKLTGAGDKNSKELQGSTTTNSNSTSNNSTSILMPDMDEQGRRSSADSKDTLNNTLKGIKEQDLEKIRPFRASSNVQADIEVADEKQLARLMSIYETSYNYKKSINSFLQAKLSTKLVSPYPDTRPISITVSCNLIAFDNGNLEPLFCRVALYDAKNHRKLSEDFGFTKFKDPDFAVLSKPYAQKLKDAAKRNVYDDATVMIKIQEPHPDIYLVIYMDRIYQNNIDASFKGYKEGSKVDAVRANVKSSGEYFGEIRQNFLFGFTKIFTKKDNVTTDVIDTVTLKELYRIPANSSSHPFDIISAIMAPADPKNKIGCMVKFTLSQINTDKVNEYQQKFNSLRLQKQLPAPAMSIRGTKYAAEQTIDNFFRISAEFPTYITTSPNLYFNNSLYVYPDFADMGNLKAKSVMLKFSLKMDDRISAPSEKRIASLFDHTIFDDYFYTCITYHQKAPQFLDEFRIDLPLHMPTKTNILIELFDVASGADKAKKGSHMTKIGFAYLPILSNHTFTSDGSHELPVYKYLPDGYLHNAVATDLLKGVNIHLRTKHASTIYTQDQNACAFFAATSRLFQILTYYTDTSVPLKQRRDSELIDLIETFLEKICEDIGKLKDANTIELLQHVPLIFNIVFRNCALAKLLIPTAEEKQDPVYSNDTVQMFALKCEKYVPRIRMALFKSSLHFLANIIRVTNEKDRKNSHLNQYVQYFFKNADIGGVPFYHHMLDLWLDFFYDVANVDLMNYKPRYEWDPEEHSNRKSWSRWEQPSKAEPKQASPQANDGPEKELCAADGLRFSWFFFDLISKSIAAYVTDAAYGRDFVMNDKVLGAKLEKLLKCVSPVLIHALDNRFKNGDLKDMAELTSAELGNFVYDNLSVLNPATVLQFIKIFVDSMKNTSSYHSLLKLLFLDIIISYDGFVVFAKQNWSSIKFVFEEYSRTIVDSINTKFEDLPTNAIKSLRYTLTKLDYDSRLQSPKDREDFVTLFFPLVQIIVSTIHMQSPLSNLSTKPDLLVDFYVCFLYIIFNTSLSIKEAWVSDNSYDAAHPLCEVLIDAYNAIRAKNEHNSKMKRCISYMLLTILNEVIEEKYLKVVAKKLLAMSKEEAEKLKSNVEAQEEQDQILEVFQKSVHLLLNLILSSPSHDGKTVCTFFETALSPFLSKFGKLFRYTDSGKETFKEGSAGGTNIRDYIPKEYLPLASQGHSTFGTLFGGVLLHCAFPTSQNVHTSVASSFTSLASFYNRLPDDDDDKTAHDSDDEDDAKPKVDITDADEIQFDAQDTNIIVGATLRKLVERLYAEDKSNPPFYQTFFMTYRSFTTPLDVMLEFRRLLKKVVTSEEKEEDKQRKLIRSAQLFKHWVTNHYSDMDMEFVSSFVNFLDSDYVSVIQAIAPKMNIEKMLDPLVRPLARRLLDVSLSKQISKSSEIPATKLPARFSKQNLTFNSQIEFNILEWDSMELARQITLIDFEIFKSLQYNEFFYQKKKSDDDYTVRKNQPIIWALGERFNQFTMYVVTTILRQPDTNKRKDMIKKFVEIMDKLFELKNLNAVNMIVGAFQNAAIYRLKIWDAMPGEIVEKRDYYSDLVAHPYNKLRAKLESMSPPAVPYVGVYKTELEFSQLNNKYLPPQEGVRKIKLINFKRCLLIVKTIQTMREKQQKYYEFHPIPYIIRVLSKDIFGDLLDKDQAFAMSLQIQPREQN